MSPTPPLPRLSRLLAALLILLTLASSVPPARAATITVTVSGTVTGPNGPVSQAWVGVWTQIDWRETTTNAAGHYSVTLQTSGHVEIQVRPPRSTMLSQANCFYEGITANVVQNFTVQNGRLFSLRPTGSSGQPVREGLWIDLRPLLAELPNQWYYHLVWDDSLQRFEGVLPKDIYHLTIGNTPAGYYETQSDYDLRTTDQAITLPLNTSPVNPIPYEPPVAAKITVGPPDGLGEAQVTGAPGAARPLSRVMLVNLNSAHLASTVSEGDGSFSARIFAPPGSALMVKHGPWSQRWRDLDVGVSEGLNPYPGTILHVDHEGAAPPGSQAFATAGAVQAFMDDIDTTRNYVGAAWSLSGSLGRVVVDGEWTRQIDGQYAGANLPGLYLGGLNWTHPAFGDLDADGDLELLVGERSGRLVLYRNLGSRAAPNWRFETDSYAGVDTGAWAYPVLADVTGDGALDLFVGSEQGAISIYYNTGTPAAPAWPARPNQVLTAGRNAAPALDDLDGDGDLDLVAGHNGGTLYHFKNTGTPQAPVWSPQGSSYGGISESGGWLQPVFINLDSDSDRDLLVGLCGQMVWYRRAGTAASPTWTRVASDPINYGGGSCANSPTAGDWDGDNSLDLAVGEHWGVLRFFRNTGPSAWTVTGFDFPIDLQGDTAPALADWDADGDLDLLLGQAHGEVYKYTNTGSNSSPDWRPDGVLLTLPWTNHPHAYPALADIDGDGDKDLFVGEGGWQSSDAGGNLHYYRNNGTPAAPNWGLVTSSFLGLDVGAASTPTFADIDADGDLDLFVGCAAGTLAFVRNGGTPTAPAWASPLQPYAGLQLGRSSAPAFIDLDLDGDLDLLSGQEDGSLSYVRNIGTRFVPQWETVATVYPGIDIGLNSIPVAGDLSGDGKPDLLLGDGDGGLNLFVYAGPGSPPPATNGYAPGDLFQFRSTLRIYSPAITPSTALNTITAEGGVWLLLQNDAAGRPISAENYFMSSLLTPTGFPIQGTTRPHVYLETAATLANLRRSGDHAVEGDFDLTVRLPANLPAGVYRPLIGLYFTGVPTNTAWLAANVTYHTVHPQEAALPPIVVGQPAAPRLHWRLLMDDFVQGTRGVAAQEDQGSFELASQIVSQGAALTLPPVDERTGAPIQYRLEPFLPVISYTDRRMPSPPLIPFELPGGQLHVTVQKPDGSLQDLGSEPFAQSFNRTKTTRLGLDLNNGTVQLEDVYSLKAASNRFRVTFDQWGRHLITMTGTVKDVWGNTYSGGGTYEVWVANPLDIDPGVLPGTPLAAGESFNPSLQLSPGVPAEVTWKITHYPNSDPAQKITYTVTGQANAYGYFSPAGSPPVLAQPGEYRVDLTARYTDPQGKVWMGALTWGGVVMTPPAQADLVAHGRRGIDTLQSIPNHWFVSGRDLTIPPGVVSHSLNPYYNGDILWSRMSDTPYGGDALVLGASVQDRVGSLKAAIQARAERLSPGLSLPGSLNERFSREEIPLFISTTSGHSPVIMPQDVDQIAYSYRYSQRPGLRVREVVSEDGQSGGYWRLDTLYDDQLSVGIQGDLPNDFKFQYVGVVYRDLLTGHSEYLGQGSGWVFIPDSDPLGSRVMPPFAGPGNGGWTTEGGPILTLKGKDIHIFILPTGVQAGTVLAVGQRFSFAGHVMPTLDSQVSWTATAPSGVKRTGGGKANSIGYFYDPADDFTVNEPGLWSLDVQVLHNGLCSGGQTVAPYPSGDMLGSANGRVWFYVVPAQSEPLPILSPASGFLTFRDQVTPIPIQVSLPAGWSAANLDWTIRMPGFILAHGQAAVSGGLYTLTFDPAALQQDFPNLDLTGRDDWIPGLSDTFTITLLLRGQLNGQPATRAATLTLQGQQVYAQGAGNLSKVYLPVTRKTSR